MRTSLFGRIEDTCILIMMIALASLCVRMAIGTTVFLVLYLSGGHLC